MPRSAARAGRGLHHGQRLEPGDLEHDRGRGVGDLGVEAAHHAAHADRHVVGVADQQVVGRERALGAVERRDRLAVAAQPDAEAAAPERVEIVCVVRLVELEHHVVADVDDVADRAHAGGGQPAGHPRRATGRRGRPT